MQVQDSINDLLAAREIERQLFNYCRGLDRMDEDLARAVWHTDGTAHYYDMYEGSADGFIAWVWEAHAAMERHSHQLSNPLIEVDGKSARSECYVTVALWTLADAQGAQQEIIGRGRYLDRWSCRDGRWAIDHREHVLDMQTISRLEKGGVSAQSRRDKQDASYGLFDG